MVSLFLTLSLIVAAAPDRAEAERARDFWSFRPRARVTPLELRDRKSARNAIDLFVLARLEAAGLRLGPPATRRELIRRLSFDLTGLPPAPDEIAAFEADPSPLAYERLVDRLLASPRHGERWGQHWLDVVRFSETEGFEYDRSLPGVWRYRDYVIRSLNRDLPFDRFVTEQLAGDEIDPEATELKVAAGFHRLGAVRRNAGNQEVASSRNEVLTERTDIIGSAFLGLTLGCARCHDHKFDPISQRDYYRLQAFLAATEEHDVPLSSPEEHAEWKSRTEALRREIERIKRKLETATGEAEASLRERLEKVQAELPSPLPTISSVRNAEEPTPIHVLARGEWLAKGESVGMQVPAVLRSSETPELPLRTERPRTLLARWLVSPRNPLTARVIVNRIWQSHFGRGIVETANDFGARGSPPSHPRLLDYLANELVAGGWRLKPIHRLILLSATYRQSSRVGRDGPELERDPENRLLWRFRRRRIDAEELRDAMLAVSGRLNSRSGGASVVVPVEPALIGLLYDPKQWTVTPDPREHDRRSIYILAKRNLRLPFMEVFDRPSLQTSCARRESSIHAPQALELLNGRISNDLARSFAERLRREAGPSPSRQVRRAFLLALGRRPTAREEELATRFLDSTRNDLAEFALAIFNLNAFLHVD